MTPRLCVYATVWHTCSNIPSKRGRSAAGELRAFSSSVRVRPLTSFMVKNGR
jgi:hypothetical protein